MSWGKLLQPDLVLGDSVLGLTPDVIHRYQLQGLVLDVDETLVPIREAETSVDVQQWFAQIKALIPLWLVSNNLNAYRIGRIADTLGVPYETGAGKPSRRKLRRATRAMALPVERVA
ncbi:MAG: YqeG family HAD IIIA-type phosphatase, partial [Cyanobacteria bacterium]|nr:YqeG family HAD IIIA-type phosphatase [Cyanobacteriota bacterium]